MYGDVEEDFEVFGWYTVNPYQDRTGYLEHYHDTRLLGFVAVNNMSPSVCVSLLTILFTGCSTALFTSSNALYIHHIGSLWTHAAASPCFTVAITASFCVDPCSCSCEPSLERCNTSWAVAVPIWFQPTHPIYWLLGGLHIASPCSAITNAGDSAGSSSCHQDLCCVGVRWADAA